ncbi:MAG: chemotaxis protein CheW [Coriobacteriia bacterium]|nr:chemotaxis protein CheW [Coriobacteriia bacterium]
MTSETPDIETLPDEPLDEVVATVGDVRLVVAFHLAGQRYALPLERVNEIQQIVAFAETPVGRCGVVGMVNLRGAVIPALDMRLLVGLDPQEYTLQTPMIITQGRGQTIALIVDEVEDVIGLPPNCVQAAPPLHALAAKMIGVCSLTDGLLNLLDVDSLLDEGLTGGDVQ